MNPRIRQTKDGIWVLCSDSHISVWVEEKGSLQHDYAMLPEILPEIPVGGVVVDVGANIGDTAIPFLDRIGPSGKLFVFEPGPDVFECLKLNLKDRNNVWLYQAAVSDSNENLRWWTGPNVGAACIRSEGVAVASIAIDSVAEIEHIDFLKIDAEGHEVRVLCGAEQKIRQFRPKMLIEVNVEALRLQGFTQWDIFNWLKERRYSRKPVQADITDESPQYDILCLP